MVTGSSVSVPVSGLTRHLCHLNYMRGVLLWWRPSYPSVETLVISSDATKQVILSGMVSNFFVKFVKHCNLYTSLCPDMRLHKVFVTVLTFGPSFHKSKKQSANFFLS